MWRTNLQFLKTYSQSSPSKSYVTPLMKLCMSSFSFNDYLFLISYCMQVVNDEFTTSNCLLFFTLVYLSNSDIIIP